MTTCRDSFVTLMKVVSHRRGVHLPSDATPEAGTGEGALIRRYRTRPRPGKSEWKLTDALSDADECGLARGPHRSRDSQAASTFRHTATRKFTASDRYPGQHGAHRERHLGSGNERGSHRDHGGRG